MIFNKLPQLGLVSLSKGSSRFASILSSLRKSPVIVSSNKDVYTNLALEHWLYNNLKFAGSTKLPIENDGLHEVLEKPVVFIWTDEPSVVIGRHQNPWLEATLGFVNKAGIKLARRHSGGGCVYHDENNINISIIGNREIFERRQENLKFLAKVLDDKYDIKCEPTKRHDLVHSESRLKMSGSAAKLGRFNCYHHFTLLVDTDKEIMETAIRQNQQEFIHTNSTQSRRSKVLNLKELKPDLEVNQVLSDLAIAYGDLYKANNQSNSLKTDIVGNAEDNASLKRYKEELETWDWIYGKTPKFKLERQVKLVECGQEILVIFRVTINRGKFDSFEIVANDPNICDQANKFDFLIGTNFSYTDAMVNVVKMIQLDETGSMNSYGTIGSEQIFATYLLQMIQDAHF